MAVAVHYGLRATTMQPNTIGSEDRSVEYGWFTKTSLVREHTAEGHMQVAEMHKHKKADMW